LGIRLFVHEEALRTLARFSRNACLHFVPNYARNTSPRARARTRKISVDPDGRRLALHLASLLHAPRAPPRPRERVCICDPRGTLGVREARECPAGVRPIGRGLCVEFPEGSDGFDADLLLEGAVCGVARNWVCGEPLAEYRGNFKEKIEEIFV
jgi:hypothetical protein